MIIAWIIAGTPEIVDVVFGFFARGGLFMWPLLFASIVTVATIVLSALTLREKKVLPLVIESEIERLVPGGSPERLLRITARHTPNAPMRISYDFNTGRFIEQ